MTVLEAIQEANQEAGITSLAFASIQEFQAFMHSFEYDQYPVNIVLPFTQNGTTLDNRRKAVVPLEGWVVRRIPEDTNDFRSLSVETLYLQPMRTLAIKFIKKLLDTDIIDPEETPVRDVIRPEYMFLPAHVFGVHYTLQLPILESAC